MVTRQVNEPSFLVIFARSVTGANDHYLPTPDPMVLREDFSKIMSTKEIMNSI